MQHSREFIGKCPICDRDMVKGVSVDEHHFLPKSKGGKAKDKILIHLTCHRKLHHTFTNKELATIYNTPKKCREHKEIAKYIKWLKKKDPEFIDSIHDTKTRRKKRR